MATEESNISAKIMMAAAKEGATLFKNVRGFFWTLDMQRKIRAGLQCGGSSDLIGWTRVKVTEDMVGKTVAIFTCIEAKTATGGNGSPDQKLFIANVKKAGGIAGIARNESDAIKLLS